MCGHAHVMCVQCVCLMLLEVHAWILNGAEQHRQVRVLVKARAQLCWCPLQVLSDSSLRARLQAAGRATALQYTPTCVLEQLEGVLYSLTACGGQLLQIRQAAASSIHLACSWASQACSKAR